MFNIKNEILNANDRINKYIRKTPLEYSVPLSTLMGCQVFLKCENLQYTGSFKVRGAFNKILSLSKEQLYQGIVAASSGNHGAAVALALRTLKVPGVIFVPENVSSTKEDNIRNYGIPLEFYGTDCVETELYAREYAQKHNKIYVSPYNDLHVLSGQGTIGLEITEQLKDIDVIFVPIGGGGLISGVAGYIKEVSPHTQIMGCMPENSPVMAKSIAAGRIVSMETYPTFSDATGGGIEANSITFDLCKSYVDDYILVSEQEIKEAICSIIKTHHQLVEGASGVALASLLKNANKFKGKKVVILLSGANISLETLREVIR